MEENKTTEMQNQVDDKPKRLNLPNPVVVCKKCQSPQFTIDKSIIHQSKSDYDIFKKLTSNRVKSKNSKHSEYALKLVPNWMKQGKCKIADCGGYWFDGKKIEARIPRVYSDEIKQHFENKKKESETRKSDILLPSDIGFNKILESL